LQERREAACAKFWRISTEDGDPDSEERVSQDYITQSQLFRYRRTEIKLPFAGEEGSSLCKILANQHGGWGSRFRGDIILNGIK
jgi:hypothetical protein